MNSSRAVREVGRFFSRVWNEDFSAVQIGTSSLPERLGARGFAAGEHILLAHDTSMLCQDGAELLAHEMVHVRQQRRLRAPARRFEILNDERLEDEALCKGEFFGRMLWADERFRRSLEDPVHRGHKEVDPLVLPRLRLPNGCAAGGYLQCLIDVDGETWTKGVEPMASWGLSQDQTKLYKHMLNDPNRTFYFPTRAALLKFTRDKVNLFKGTDFITGPIHAKLFEKVVSAAYHDFQKRDTTWCARIRVVTDKGTETFVHVYSSVKRHLISSFMQSQFSPRDRKLSNLIVRSDAILEQKLIEYARFHAAKIKANCMLFGYNPVEAAAGHTDPIMKIATETTFTPSSGWAYENPIHCYPESGTETRSLTQDQYNALVIFLLWYFRTDEHLQEGKCYNKIRHLDSVAASQKMEEIEKDLRTVKARLQSLDTDYKVTFPVDDVDAKAVSEGLDKFYLAAKPKPSKHYRQLIADALRNLHGALVLEGHVPALLTNPIPGKDKPAGAKAASTAVGAPEVYFKTHKVEVKRVSGHLTPDLIAWVLDGHLAMDANDLLTVITSSSKAKAHVKEQIGAANRQMSDEAKDMEVAIKRLSQFVGIAKLKGKLA